MWRIARPLSSGEEVVTTKQVAGRAGFGPGCNAKMEGTPPFCWPLGSSRAANAYCMRPRDLDERTVMDQGIVCESRGSAQCGKQEVEQSVEQYRVHGAMWERRKQ